MKKCCIGDEYQNFGITTGLDFTGSTLGNDFTVMFVDPSGNYYQVPLSQGTSGSDNLKIGQIHFVVNFIASSWTAPTGGHPTSLTPGIVLYQAKKVLGGKIEYTNIFSLELNDRGVYIIPSTPPPEP